MPASEALPWLIGAPVVAIVLYGLTRITMTLLVQVREGMFAKVAMHAVRKLALTTFEHMHRLSLRFHLERKTGGLTRVLERGRARHREHHAHDADDVRADHRRVRAGARRVRVVVRLALCAHRAAMIVLYLWFTVRATDWRIQIRRTMNESDTEANTKAIDSLLNYETVKYFGAEEREAQRYDQLDGRLRAGQRQDLHLARRAQHRPGGDLHGRADAVHGDGGPRRRGRHARRSASS